MRKQPIPENIPCPLRRKTLIEKSAKGRLCKLLCFWIMAVFLSFTLITIDSFASDGDLQISEPLTSAEEADPGVPSLNSIENADVVLSKRFFTYDGNVHTPSILKINGQALTEGTDYTLTWSNGVSKKAGTYTITIKGIGNYTGKTKASYTIERADNPMSVRAKRITLKRKKLRKHSVQLKRSKALKISHAKGRVSFDKVSGDRHIRIKKKTGKITVKKGIKKGTYIVKMKVIASGTVNYEPLDEVISLKIRIK